jgi:hypothetical protein
MPPACLYATGLLYVAILHLRCRPVSAALECPYATGLLLRRRPVSTPPACFYAAILPLRRWSASSMLSSSLLCYRTIIVRHLSLRNSYILFLQIDYYLDYSSPPSILFFHSSSNCAYEVCDFCVALSATFLSNIIFTLLSRADLECLKYCHVPAKFFSKSAPLMLQVLPCSHSLGFHVGGRGGRAEGGILLMYSATAT